MTYGCMTIGISLRAALINAVCRKSFGMAAITKVGRGCARPCMLAADGCRHLSTATAACLCPSPIAWPLARSQYAAVTNTPVLLAQEMASDAVAFVASDVTKIFDGIQDIHYLWTAPFEALAILTILVVLVKEWALPGWGVVGIIMPMQYLVSSHAVTAACQGSWVQ